MSRDRACQPRLTRYYRQYLREEDSAAFIRSVSQQYTVGSLQRLAVHDSRVVRRAAVLALGFLADFSSNAVLGEALHDEDRGVRIIAENGIRELWQRDGSEVQRQQLRVIARRNGSHRFAEAADLASRLLEAAPWFAEAWNQRAIAYFSSGRYADSVRDCRQTLEINPYHFGAAAGMGQCYLELKQPRLALESFRRALRLNPNLEGVRAHVVALERTWNKKK